MSTLRLEPILAKNQKKKNVQALVAVKHRNCCHLESLLKPTFPILQKLWLPYIDPETSLSQNS
jgi:hypothetical protein